MSIVPSAKPKLIYFAERHPELTGERFRMRWRQHARLGMSQPRWRNVWRYAHCDSVEMPDGPLPIAWCDGVATVSYLSEEHRLRHVSDSVAGPAMKRDEAETFARPVRTFAVLCEEYPLLPCAAAPYKLFLRLWAPSGQTSNAFRRVWLDELGPRSLEALLASGGCRGYLQNHARGVDSAEGVPPPLCDGVDEVAVVDPAAVGTAVGSVLAEAGEKVGKAVAVWTRETVLHQR